MYYSTFIRLYPLIEGRLLVGTGGGVSWLDLDNALLSELPLEEVDVVLLRPTERESM